MNEFGISTVPGVSIIMPAFNKSQLVIEMLHSIQRNTYTNWELIIVDDGSTDEDYNNVHSYVSSDSRIKHFRREEQPKGAQNCRNIGLSLARGKYVCFFDSDDLITPSCLEKRVKKIGECPDVDFVVFPSMIMKDGEISQNTYNAVYGYPIYKDDLAAFCKLTLPFIVWNNIYRRESLLRHNLTWDLNVASLQDSMFNIQALLLGMKYVYGYNNPDYIYRLDTQGSISKKIGSKKHIQSNLYNVETFYKLVQSKYGHKYDYSLYCGAMFLCSSVARSGNVSVLPESILPVIKRYSRLYGVLYEFQLRLYKVLSYFLPERSSRRIATIWYLLPAYLREKGKIRKLQMLFKQRDSD